MSNSVAITGVGESEYSWASGKSEQEMALTAIRKAIADAGLEAGQIDGLGRFSFESTSQNDIAASLGISSLRFTQDSASGAAASANVLGMASAAIQTGQADAIVCYRAFNGRSMMRLGHLPIPERGQDGNVLARGNSPFNGEFTGPYGMAAPACAFGLWVNAYMARHGISEERMSHALGTIVVRQREYAQRNPRAMLREKPIDMDGYLANPILAAPLRKVDLCLESDGACAFVVCGEKYMKRSSHRPAYILDVQQSLSPNYDHFFFDLNNLPPRIGSEMMAEILARRGIGPTDIEVVGIYDAASSSVLFDLENMGFCDLGKAVDYIAGPGVAVNTSGGMLAEVYLQGMNLVIELVRQLRGNSTNQIDNARFGALSAGGCQAVALLSNEVFS